MNVVSAFMIYAGALHFRRYLRAIIKFIALSLPLPLPLGLLQEERRENKVNPSKFHWRDAISELLRKKKK